MYKLLFYKVFSAAQTKRNQIIVNHTFGRSFKFGKRDASRPLLVLRNYIKLFFKPPIKLEKITSKNVIFDVSSSSYELRKKYLKFYQQDGVFSGVFSEELIGFETNFQKIVTLFKFCPVVIISFITSLFYKDKTSFAELINHLIIKQNLKKIIPNDTKLNVYFFSIYDLSSNYISHHLMKQGHYITKILSMAPLSLWNKNISTNSLILTGGYQKEEVDYQKDTIEYDDLAIWGPEKIYEYHSAYQNITFEKGRHKIGFYSTASYVRAQLDHIDQGVDMMAAEKTVLKSLKAIIESHPAYELIIFLHPKERKLGMEAVNKHYNQVLGNLKFSYNNPNQPSHFTFDEVELAVAFNTSLIHERIYMGFKSILFPNNALFPLPNTKIKSICAENEIELKQLILKSMELTEQEFFIQNKIEEYSKGRDLG